MNLKLRVNYDYAHLLFKEDEGVNLGDSKFGYDVKVVKFDKNSALFEEVAKTSKFVREKYGTSFFYDWDIRREYTEKEINDAKLFQMNVRKYFEPTGEECGTEYDETCICEICGSGRKQISPLRIRKGRFLNKRDVATTIGDEMVVSKKFVNTVKENGIKGMTFGPVFFGENMAEDCFQLMAEGEKLEVAEQTTFGIDLYDLSERCRKEIYRCPHGDNLGLNLISEAYVKNADSISQHDFFISKQTYGVKRGLLRPHYLLFCSPKLYRVIKENHLKGFNFEVAHIVNQ